MQQVFSPPSASERRSVGHKVLFVTSEMAGFVKAGGLGDVSAALPRAMRQRHDVRVLIPGYPQVLERAHDLEFVCKISGIADVPGADLHRFHAQDGGHIYVLVQPQLYERAGSPYVAPNGYDWVDNDLRFACLSHAAAEIARGVADPDWRPDLLHANDWPTALAPAYLAWRGERAPSVFTIHNLAYQGCFPRESLARLGVPDAAFGINGVEFYGKLSFLKAGLFYASHITTVSQTYAREITSPEAGCGLDGLLRTRAGEGRLSGILNGIDEQWDPRFEPDLFENFDAGDWVGKKRNSDAVRRQFGLGVSRGPLFAVVSRLVQQKGIDLVLDAADEIVSAGGQIVITGTGEHELERDVQSLVDRYPGHIGARIGFDESEAKNIYAASDFLLMPSRFEPCGLSQMYAQRFGSLPIAHKVGGLADSIEDGLTGLLFRKPSAQSFYGAVARAFEIFRSKRRLNKMRSAAMSRQAGWGDASSAYELLYARAIGNG